MCQKASVFLGYLATQYISEKYMLHEGYILKMFDDIAIVQIQGDSEEER